MTVHKNLLTFDIATTLPVDTLTALGSWLTLKSNSTFFVDEDNGPIMQVAASYIAILKPIDMGFQNISSVFDFTATGTISTTGAISSNSLTTNTLTTSGTSLNIKSDIVRFRGLISKFKMAYRLDH